MTDCRELAGFRKCAEHVQAQWPAFQQLRVSLLAAHERFGSVAEKAAENIIAALFTNVLDWQERDLNWQLGRADLVVTHNFVKYLIVEAKRPGLLSHKTAIDDALAQASRYAQEQHVHQVAVCDATLFYGADIVPGGWKLRVALNLSYPEPPVDALWWISRDGIHRACDSPVDLRAADHADGGAQVPEVARPVGIQALLHPKYGLPSRCFAYVGDPTKPGTWKLPYMLGDGTTDLRRLPKAIQALASNYRGAKVGGIPDAAIPHVFRRLGAAAKAEGKMPATGVTAAPAYHQLAEILQQLENAGI